MNVHPINSGSQTLKLFAKTESQICVIFIFILKMEERISSTTGTRCYLAITSRIRIIMFMKVGMKFLLGVLNTSLLTETNSSFEFSFGTLWEAERLKTVVMLLGWQNFCSKRRQRLLGAVWFELQEVLCVSRNPTGIVPQDCTPEETVWGKLDY